MSADGLYRKLLRCYPAAFRQEYGGEMSRAFRDELREARASGGLAAQAHVWRAAVADLFRIAPREHVHVMKQDLRYTIRALGSSPGFTLVAILSLALGIGANTAIFSLLNNLLFRPLPVERPHELVLFTDPASSGVWAGSQRGERGMLTYTEFERLRDEAVGLNGMLAVESSLDELQARVNGGELEPVRSRMVSAEYFEVLGVRPLLGRLFHASDGAERGAPYAVISHDYWRRRFDRSGDVLGKQIALRGGVFSIVGVAPEAFFGETVGERPDVWFPLSMQAAVLPGRDWLHDKPGGFEKIMWLHVMGRLAPGATLEQAEKAANLTFHQELTAYYGASLSPQERVRFLEQQLKMRPGEMGVSSLRARFSEPLTIMLAGAGMVLLIACANLGNLMLARTAARSREISVRLALGASRGRLVRELLTESFVLAVLGGVAGLGAAVLLQQGLLQLVSGDVVVPLAPDARVLAFAFALTLVAGLLLGVFPALRTTGVDASAGLKEQGRGLTGSAAWLRLGKLVVVGQLVLSLPLLVGAGLLLGTLYNLQNVDLGYEKERLLTVEIDAQSAGYDEALRLPLFERIMERLRLAPGVRSVSYAYNGIFSGSDSGDQVEVEGYTPENDEGRSSAYDHVAPGFFSSLGVPVLVGREIAETDREAGTRVCVINEAFSKRFFTGRNPLGMHVTQVFGSQRNTYEIVGVVKDSRRDSLRSEIGQRFYVPVTQPIFPTDSARFVIQTASDAADAAASVRAAVMEVDPNLPLPTVRPLTELVDRRMTQERLLARLSMAFGAVGLLLAAIGLYGVLSYGVSRRTNEIGIRKALGAQHGSVVGMILRETGALLAAGLAAGLVVSALSVKLIESRLYELAPRDPAAFAAAAALLSVVALLAAWIPAHRASRVDPLVALRHE